MTTIQPRSQPSTSESRPLIWVFEVVPETPNGERNQCDPRLNEAIARQMRTLPGFVASAWNRERVETVFECVGVLNDRGPAMKLVTDRVQLADPRSDGRRLDRSYELGHWPDPCDWDWLLAPIEMAARSALEGRHQCGTHSWCDCGRIGNKFDPKKNETLPLGSFVASAS
ncbi:hypothetical protein [Nocardioides albus]|uniref:Uncharacterized protein n=1 Tax=Nocardioides albus TaxID=1841 RepID=A0A7W5FBF4_9ACTN|nr:hypothetical protein [Nocardioides albus]MBB3092155.1 hypothetical protein [Nocardioides albus]GGU46223.1 hypothetical protein GCM10007979_51720 [Nocardioides albus]